MATALVIILLTLAALHLYWGLGGRWPGRDEESLVAMVVGRTRSGRMPSLQASALVAFGLAFGAWLVAADRGGLSLGAPFSLVNAGYFLMALVFAVRGMITYAFPAVFAYAKGTPFERLNRLYYSPLCLFIAFGLLTASLGLL
ncbi:MAG: DUF3995 domain-containing protein [Alphaproteobacteria bacterium]|nr:DUF3995 domain-containing protein [Alphaproteobacteria bacterium]